MKSLTRVAFYALAISLVPLSYSYADDGNMDEEEEVLTLQEAQALINSKDTAKDATGGDVGDAYVEYYDIYSRQLSFREKSKIYRASIEARRAAFEAPRTELMNEHKEIERKVFAAETAAYQAYLQEMSEQGMDDMSDDERQVISIKDEPKDTEVASSGDYGAGSADEPHVKEIEVPVDDADVNVRKKVVTSDDAPDFDPANL